ncbi:MAG: preprotein translocase subunit SecE [Lachnospiraceae bacterium]|nr:preprotein translocase subunit SecE [Lachnospiraceae bacterium]
MSDTAKTPAKESWFKGLSREFKKIIWPSKATLVKESVAVVIITVILGAIIEVVDWIVKFGLDKILAI